MENPPPKSWSIHTRPEIIAKYQILERIGSGAYSDVYKGRRLSDNLIVALKEVHDYQSAFREIDALQILQNSPNVVELIEYFWREDEDAVIVLEFLRTDLTEVIKEAKKEKGEIGVAEVKRWMVQILNGVDVCHRNMIVHRDLKPGNLLVSDDGVLKLADFGQARILMDPRFVAPLANAQANEHNIQEDGTITQHHEVVPDLQHATSGEEYFRQLDELKGKNSIFKDETDKESSMQDGNTSCLATCSVSVSELDDDDLRNSSFSFEPVEAGNNGDDGLLTSCVGTRWFRAPELLYGSTDYGLEVDLWSVGCIFAELLTLEPLFPGTSDIDQLSRVISVLGNLTEEVWPGCLKLPDYKAISFVKVENPIGIEGCLPARSPDEVSLVKKLVCYDPAGRATATELLQDRYLNEDPLPVPISELRVPSSRSRRDEDFGGEWGEQDGFDSDSDFEDFGPVKYTATSGGFSIQFP